MKDGINRERIETLWETKFLKCYDLQYAEGKHYYEASRREKDDLVVKRTDGEFRDMLPDAVILAYGPQIVNRAVYHISLG